MGLNNSKQYFIYKGGIASIVQVKDIKLPNTSVMVKHTTISCPKGSFTLVEDTEVIDIGLVLYATDDDITSSLLANMMNHFNNYPIPVVMSMSGSDNIVILSNHWSDLLKKSDEYLLSMKGHTCIGYTVEYSCCRNRCIDRPSRELTILDVPKEVDLSVLKRLYNNSNVDAIVSNRIIRVCNTRYDVQEGEFNVYISEKNGKWKISTTGTSDPIRVKAAFICWKPAKDKESLLSQLKPYIINT
jgi:hypothetical protein